MTAHFSTDTDGPDGQVRYRYTLWRRLVHGGAPYLANVATEEGAAIRRRADQTAQFICLNPSTATETVDDPTVRRCWGYAQRWGYGKFCMTNLFAFRATDPKVMLAEPEPVGPDNDAWIYRIAQDAGIIVLAWGTHGEHRNRCFEVLGMLTAAGLRHKCHTLKLTKAGAPSHPLYLRADLTPQPL